MNREIKFRGRRIDNRQWVYGQYFKTPLTDENSGTTPDAGWYFLSGEQRHCIVQDGVSFVIDEKTLGQYTGLKDKNGVQIYEGDVVRLKDYHGERIVEISFHNGVYYYTGGGFSDEYIFNSSKREVIGNIYENADLLNPTP